MLNLHLQFFNFNMQIASYNGFIDQIEQASPLLPVHVVIAPTGEQIGRVLTKNQLDQRPPRLVELVGQLEHVPEHQLDETVLAPEFPDELRQPGSERRYRFGSALLALEREDSALLWD